MSVTVARSSTWQSVESKLGIPGGWVNVCDMG